MQEQIQREAIAEAATNIYEEIIRFEVEEDANIGKMLLLDVTTGNYEFDDEQTGEAGRRLRERNPEAKLFGLRVGYNAAYAVGGTLERVTR